MSTEKNKMRGEFFRTQNWSLNKCLAPGNECASTAIRAHSVQNAQALDLLAHHGHVKGITVSFAGAEPSLSFSDVGRNRATTFEGFCANHDSKLFLPIDSSPLDPANSEQLFLYAYRSVARETHAVMEGASKMQSAYMSRVEVGWDSGEAPEPAGLAALAHLTNAHATWLYKQQWDKVLLESRFTDVQHEIFYIDHDNACIAASSCFTLEDRPDEDRIVRVCVNVFPISQKQTAVFFSYTVPDASRAKGFVMPILQADGHYQKYLLSKLILTHCENFVVAPRYFDGWPDRKRDAVISFFEDSMHHNIEREDDKLYLF